MKKNLNIATTSSWCYDNNDANCTKYGRLYTMYAARTACPSGWHLPTSGEWNDLVSAVGPLAGRKLKSKSGWSNSGNGTDNFGFSALPGGTRSYTGSFTGAGDVGAWWTSSSVRLDGNVSRIVSAGDDVSVNVLNGSDGMSVRCVAD